MTTSDKLILFSALSEGQTEAIIRDAFSATSMQTIQLQNQYFQKQLQVCTHYQPTWKLLQEDENVWNQVDANPAYAVVVQGDDMSQVQRAQLFWSDICVRIEDSATCLFYVDGEQFDIENAYKLVVWGLENNVEIISHALCAEDATDVRTRIAHALACAPWEGLLSNDEEEDEDDCSDNDDDLLHENLNCRVETRLRRRLTEADVSRIIDGLALEDDSNEDSDTT